MDTNAKSTAAVPVNGTRSLPQPPAPPRRGTFWYLASPYSKYPRGIDKAFEDVCHNAALLVAAGVKVYCPIAHTHPIAIHGHMDPLDHGIWLPADEPFMRAAHGLIVLKLESWEVSYGISVEVEAFLSAGKPVFHMEPGAVPVGVLS